MTTLIDDESRLFYNHMSSENDLDVVIKSAVWIERSVSKALNELFVDAEILKALRLNYFQRAGILVASGLQKRFHAPLKSLGNIRNRFAHELVDSISKSDADNFYNSFSSEDKVLIQENYMRIEKKSFDKFGCLSDRDKFVLCVITLRAAIVVARNQAISVQSHSG